MTASRQLGLFETDRPSDREQETNARSRMRAMIDRLAACATPPWHDHMGAILDDGAFQRAMRLVPVAEAQALRLEFDAHMDRLYSLWLDDEAAQNDRNAP